MPPPVVAPLWLAGPAATATAKLIVYEYIPALTSASLAAYLVKAAWNRVPQWIKDDVSFSKRNNANGHDSERLSTIMEKIQAWMEVSAEQFANTPVPFVYVAFLIYWQLCTDLDARDDTAPSSHEHWKRNNVSRSQNLPRSSTVKNWTEMLRLATLAYYADQRETVEQEIGDDWCVTTVYVPNRPGRVGYYVAERKGTLLVAIKGTTSLEEVLTDACGCSVPLVSEHNFSSPVEVEAAREDQIHHQDSVFSDQHEEFEVISGHERISIRPEDVGEHDIRCHQGILLSAERLLAQIQSILDDRVSRGYKLLFVGHSLGGSAACLLAQLCRVRGICTHDDQLHVYAFGPPPTLDHDSAVGAASFVTSVVNDLDLISRCSTANLAVLLDCLRQVSDEIVVEGRMTPTDPRSVLRLLKQLQSGSGAPLWTKDKLNRTREAAFQAIELRHPDHLYVPGQVYLLESGSCREVDVTALRTIELVGFRMLGDHTVLAYEGSLKALLAEISSSAAQ